MNIFLTIILWVTYLISLYISVYWMIIFVTRRGEFNFPQERRVELSSFPFVSVLIPAFNEEQTISQVIESVLALDYPKDRLEVIVVNDGSIDRTRERVEQLIDRNKRFNIVLINQKNQGKAVSLNNALKIARGDFFACLDADSFVDAGTLRKMLKIFEEEDGDLAIVTPALKVKTPKNFLQRVQWLEYLVALFIARLISNLDCIYVAPGPFSLYRTSIIKKLGGFDTESLTEDQEIAYRAQKYQYKIKQCYDGYVHTVAPETLQQLYKQRNRWSKGGLLTLLKYKKLILNKGYGDFGVMQMSINIFMFFVSAIAIFFFSIYVLKPIYEFIRKLYLVNFDFSNLIRGPLEFNLFVLNIDLEKFVIIYFLLMIIVIIIYLSHKNAHERFDKENIFSLLAYFFVYYMIISFITVVVFFEIVIEKKHGWKAFS